MTREETWIRPSEREREREREREEKKPLKLFHKTILISFYDEISLSGRQMSEISIGIVSVLQKNRDRKNRLKKKEKKKKKEERTETAPFSTFCSVFFFWGGGEGNRNSCIYKKKAVLTAVF